MTLRLLLDTDNAAFGDAPETEIARIFRSAADAIEQEGAEPGRIYRLRDYNGNMVGHIDITD